MNKKTLCYLYCAELGYCCFYGHLMNCRNCEMFIDLRIKENFDLLKKVSHKSYQVTLWKHIYEVKP